jgi:putative NADPH-quinone reductase
MESRRILIVQGHPDATSDHFCHALARSYREAAGGAGHEVRTLDVSGLDFPVLRSKQEWGSGPLPPALAEPQHEITWAEHLLIVFPLWLGDMPALLKAFFEQVARPGFAVGEATKGRPGRKLLGGRSARIVVTMGMPAFVYRWYFGAHSVKSLEQNILRFAGIAPVRRSLVGLVEGPVPQRRRWLERLASLGREGA